MKKIKFEDFKEPFISAETLNEMQNNAEEAINEKGNGSGVYVGTEEPTDTNVWINPDEPLKVVGTEVVDSLSGNETNKAPSVRAVKEYLTYSEEETIVGYTIKNGKEIPVYRKTYSGITSSDSNVKNEYMNAISDMSEIFKMWGISTNSAGYKNIIPNYFNNENYIAFAIDDQNRPYLSYSTMYKETNYKVFVDYIKTTDLLEGGETNEI